MSLFLHIFLDILQGHLVSVMTDSKLAGKKVKRNNTFILPSSKFSGRSRNKNFLLSLK